MASAVGTPGTTNGRGHGPVPAFAVSLTNDDPMSKVLGLDARTSGLLAWFGFTSAGTLFLVWLMGLALIVTWWRAAHTRIVAERNDEIEIVREDAPPPPIMEPEPKAEPPPPRPVAHEAAPPPPPAPAQAARVLTQEPKPDEPVDLTGNTIVTGNADHFAGAFTSANGTNPNAVHTLPGPTGVPGGGGPAQAAPPKVEGPDQSRTASLGGGGEWSCPFPAEADAAQVDEAYVTLQVDVRADGTPGSVRVLGDPGNGFGREARRCAMNKRYTTARDHDGNAIAGTTKAFRVHFSR